MRLRVAAELNNNGCLFLGLAAQQGGREKVEATPPLHTPPPLMSQDTGEDWRTIISPLKGQWAAIRQIGEKVSDVSKPSERCDFLDTCTPPAVCLTSLLCCQCSDLITPNCVTFKYTNIVFVLDLKGQCGTIH